jgi:DNA-binding IclR family transcriptional regulator
MAPRSPNCGFDSGDDPRSEIKSLGTAFTIAEQLKNTGPARVTELASATGYSKSTVHQHLATLRAHDFVVKDGNQYELGLRFLDIGGLVRRNRVEANVVKPKIKELGDKTDEVAIFTTEERGLAVILYREAGQHGVYTKARPGKRIHLHQVAAGKAILSQHSDERVKSILCRRGLQPMTEKTITDREELLKELDVIRERGFALSLGESTEGVRAAAVPMQTPRGDVMGACAVAGPAHRMEGSRLREEIPDLIRSVVNEMELNIAHS